MAESIPITRWCIVMSDAIACIRKAVFEQLLLYKKNVDPP
jgi:hypothetical protein